MEKDESKSTRKEGATNRGNKVGALVLVEVVLWCLTQCAVHVDD